MEEKFCKTEHILVRSTGTKPIIPVMMEGADRVEIDAMADELCELIHKADKI